MKCKATLFLIFFVFFIPTYSLSDEAKSYQVIEVVDGDTIRLAGGKIVDFIGIDAPEKKMSGKLRRDAAKLGVSMYDVMKMGRDASGVLYGLIGSKPVTLEFDAKRENNQGHYLAYVYNASGLMLNESMLYEGHARVVVDEVNIKHREKFLLLEKDAKEYKRGIWTDIELDTFHK